MQNRRHPWLLWAPLAALTAATAVFGLRTGWQVATLTETDVINSIAADYVTNAPNRKITDCSAAPSKRAGIWLTVTCAPTDASAQQFHVNRFGGLEALTALPQAPEI